MLKLTVTVLAVALAGTASAGGWRPLRVDGSSEAAFQESVAALQAELPEVRRYVFALALQDVWVLGVKGAEAEQRDYTAGEYFRQLDGLGYKEVVTLADPTGDTADMRFRRVYAHLYRVNTVFGNNYSGSNESPTNGVRGSSLSGDASAREECGCAFPHAANSFTGR